jgi:tetratricopeptide (TPR) repeat protein
MPRQYSQETIKILFGQAGGRCAYPGCENPLIADATDTDRAAVIGQIAHIVASSSHGPRGDPAFPPQELDREPNLVLLCAHHHTLVDAQHSTYTVDDLRSWKEAQRRELVASHATVAAAARIPVPRQLPPVPHEFVNRHAEVGSIDLLARRPPRAGAPPIVVLFGGHGVGKSATGAHWAHCNSGRYSDGQLYADFGALRHRGGVGVGDVLGGFLRALGLGDDVIPANLAERTALFRSRLAGRSMLLLLDDVEHAAHVTPLIPNTAESLVLVTTRAPLEELVQQQGADVVPLLPLDHDSSADLLSELIGPARVRADPAAVELLARFCGGLPVALRICGARLSGAHARKPVSWLTEQLADESQRLRRMPIEPGHTLQAVFDDAYHALGPAHATLYRRLGIHPGPSFTSAAAAAVASISVASATELLDDLCVAHLVEDIGDRFRLHDLLRAHARGTAQRIDTELDQETAIGAFVDFYLAATQRMDRAIVPDRLRLSVACPPAASGEPAPDSAAAALAWFEAERANLTAAQRAAAEREWDEKVWQFAEAMWLGYQNHKHFEEAREVYTLGVAAAKRTGMPEVQARMHQLLARPLMDLEEDALAGRELDLATRLLERSENRRLRASVVEFTGVLYLNLGEYPAAVDAFEQARKVYEAEHNPRGVMLQEYLLGRALTAMGRHRDAIECFERAIELTDPDVDGLAYGRTLIQLGGTQRAIGEDAAASVTLELAARTMREHDAPYFEIKAVEALAEIRRAENDDAGEASYLRRMLDLLIILSSPRANEVSERLQLLQ